MWFGTCNFHENWHAEGCTDGHQKKNIHACTMKLYDSLDVKNALVKPVHCVMKYSICNLFFKSNQTAV